ncbi:MAG: glycoside hydrolase family 31 protein [Bacteroidales bacterium]|nr:glycoside hydrolase family 31 protein [Bacteroidales bacterium]
MIGKLLAGICALVLFSCAEQTVRTTGDGVVVSLNDKKNEVRKVRLQVINDRIIRVSATPDKQIPETKSLITVPQKLGQTPFAVTETDSTVSITTATLKAVVSLKSGAVHFYNPEGKVLLSEKPEGGKSFTPIEVEGTKGYTMRQLFDSPNDEAFYGLGQHQSDEFNYKGKNEVLYQYNTKVSVPFVISNKNYGLLWDNYSLSRFGDDRDYAQLKDAFKLYNAQGETGGLTATYTPSNPNGQTIVRTEDSIFYEDAKSVKNLPERFQLGGSQVLYEGELEPLESGTYRFLLYYAGYVKVYVNHELIVPERWRTAWNPNSYKFSLPLEKGKRISLRIEWKPDGGVSYLGFRALTPVPDAEQNQLAIWSEMGKMMDYYFIAGNSMDQVISGYRTITGKSQIMPKWAMGFWQSRERYENSNQLLGVVNEFRKRQIPMDNIVLDWRYWVDDQWGSHDFDSTRFSDPKGMVDSVHAMNAHIMISVWPKFYLNTEHYKEFDSQGWMYQQAIKDSIRDWVGPGYVNSFYDAYAEGARKLFWKQMKDHLYPLGIDAWWMDASEPNIRDCTDMDYRKQLCGPTALGPSTEYLNAYALVNAQAIYEGQRQEDPNRRVFLLTRSGFSGLQRYSTATWSGDIATRWEDMKAQISAGLNFSISGIPYWTMDIGGFCVENRYSGAQREFDRTGKENEDLKEWRELETRWYQFGAFAPLYRAHGQFPYREVYNVAPETHPAYQSITYFTKLRYRLMPYIYSLAGKTYFNDYTIMRPLVMDFGKDTKVNNIGDQYMFGSALMVCPVYQYGLRQRTVYFPATNGWYDFYSGKHIAGGQSLSVEAPYERIPLFVPEGAILPVGPEIQYASEKQADHITLYVYEGRNGSFTLYEDEDVNYNYEKGACAMIPFTYDEASHTLEIGARQGEFPGMLKERTFTIVSVKQGNAVPFSPDAKGMQVTYTGSNQTIKL